MIVHFPINIHTQSQAPHRDLTIITRHCRCFEPEHGTHRIEVRLLFKTLRWPRACFTTET